MQEESSKEQHNRKYNTIYIYDTFINFLIQFFNKFFMLDYFIRKS